MDDKEARERGYKYYGLIFGVVPGYGNDEVIEVKHEWTNWIVDLIVPWVKIWQDLTNSEPGFSLKVLREIWRD